jgi:hypothetical protein
MVKGKKHEDVSVDRPDDTATDPLTQSASGSPEGRARDYARKGAETNAVSRTEERRSAALPARPLKILKNPPSMKISGSRRPKSRNSRRSWPRSGICLSGGRRSSTITGRE